MISHSQQLAWQVLIYSPLVNGFWSVDGLLSWDMAIEAATREDKFTSGSHTLRQCYVAYNVINTGICYKAVLTYVVKSQLSLDNTVGLENIICYDVSD